MYVLASLYFMYTLKGRLDAVDQKQAALESAQTELTARLHSTKSEFKEALTSQVGQTKEEIARRAAELERQQKAGEAKLSAAQNQQGQQIAAVSGEVSGVKTEVGAAKTDIAKTQTDLQATNQKLEHTIGDLGVQSGLIAHTSAELDVLKHKGDRNYFDFTLKKGAKTPDFDGELRTEEGGCEEEPVHAQRDCGRQDHREEGPHGRASRCSSTPAATICCTRSWCFRPTRTASRDT